MKPTFYQWLQKYKNDDTLIGDLARVASLDIDRPRSNNLTTWEQHVTATGGSYSSLKLLRETWPKYEFDLPVEPSNEFYKLQLRDEHWEIKRPILPRWSDQTHPLIHVRTTPETEETFIKSVASPMFCNAVEQFGRYFCSEFSYDFLPYTFNEHTSSGDSEIHPYLFFEEKEKDVIHRPIGACGFQYVQEHQKWFLTWIWMHPFARRRGYVSKAWAQFRQRYNDFDIREPVSPAMIAFIKKHQDSNAGN